MINIDHFEGLAQIFKEQGHEPEMVQALLESEITQYLTDDFLNTLVIAARVMMLDYPEVEGFVEDLFVIAGKEENIPILDPLVESVD